MNDILKKLSELDEDAKILEDLEKAESVEDFIETFKKYGIETTEEELSEFFKTTVSNEENELTEEDLENVAGGGWVRDKVEKVRTWAGNKGAAIWRELFPCRGY